MDAMAARSANPRLAQLWQLPLLLLSLGLFAYAAWLFIDPQPGPTIDQQIEFARTCLKEGRPRAAIDHLNRLLDSRMDALHEGSVHLLLGAAIEAGQKEQGTKIAENYLRIIEQTKLALDRHVKPDAAVYIRMAEAYEALEKPADAVANYRQAITLDPARTLQCQRKMIVLQLAQDDRAGATVSLEEYLRHPQVSASERAWAMGEMAHVLIDRNNFAEARQILNEARPLAEKDAVEQGQINYWLGYCAWRLGEKDESERYMRVARDQLRVRHPLDAEAALILGRICQDKNDWPGAISFFDSVLTSHPDARTAPLARLGRGVCRISRGDDDAGLSDLHDLVAQVLEKSALERNKAEVLAGLRQAGSILVGRSNYQGALELLGYEQQLEPEPPAAFFQRLAAVYEQRADQLEKKPQDPKPADTIRREQQIRELRCKAGDACIAFSRSMTVTDDKRYGDALWKGIQLYNRAGDLQRVISALDLFVTERPEDPLTPDALLQLGQACQAAGLFDRAIAAYQRNLFRYPKTLAASRSAVPLAQAYVAKGPDFYRKAEQVLRSVVEDNEVLTPDAAEFRQSLFELAQLYYRTARYEEAIARLEELIQRYPDQPEMGQLLFLMGDSYRKSAQLLDSRLAARGGEEPARQALDTAEAAQAKKDRLTRAREFYEKVIENYRTHPPQGDLASLQLKLSYFYRADCLYDMGEFAEAIKLYDGAAFRYQDDPSALAAYVQIVNANCALGRMDEARAANERAKWLLRRMPADLFANGNFSMPKQYWEQWLTWSGEMGMWKNNPATQPVAVKDGAGASVANP